MSMSAGQLESITTRDTVETRVGTLEFRDRAPTADTAQRRLIPRMTSDRGATSARRERDGARACAVHKIVTTGSSASERL